jgi:hypothetical protein
MTTILTGHVSPETAYVVADYPYGFRLRCQIRYWVEYQPNKGFRFWSQTTNPKRPGTVWNKPKAGTYFKFGGAMFLNGEGHVQFAGLSEYSSAAEASQFAATYGAGVPEAGREILAKWVAAKIAYDAARPTKTEPLNVGLAEARKAFIETK